MSAVKIHIEKFHFFGSISSSMILVPIDGVEISVVGVEMQSCFHLFPHRPRKYRKLILRSILGTQARIDRYRNAR